MGVCILVLWSFSVACTTALQVAGNVTDAPWPWRVDSVSGAFLNGHKNSDSVFPLRLFRGRVLRVHSGVAGSHIITDSNLASLPLHSALAAPPFSLPEFSAPAASLWAWIRDFQLPTASPDVAGPDSLWVNFFEDRTQVCYFSASFYSSFVIRRLYFMSFRRMKRTGTLGRPWSLLAT
jgi:hypothetical protein